jgi:eukaryotic-like serine/threonine-protein kinase
MTTKTVTVTLADRANDRHGVLGAQAEEMLPDAPLEPGSRLDRYLILSRLGGGGMVTVYKARDTELDREVALKVLGRPYCHQPDLINRFRAEAQTQARLHSPHIVTLYSLLELSNAAVLVLEYIEGDTLEHRLRVGGPLSEARAVGIFDQALRGLEHIHEMGIIHRDLKPSNLFLTTGGQVKIMDFSVAKMPQQDIYPLGTMVGTLLYISPEQVRGKPVDARADIYALGVSLYESVTGRLPFVRNTDYGLMHAHVQDAPPNPRELQPSLSPELERVILKAIEKDPKNRYRSAHEFRAALLRLGLVDDAAHATLPANAFGPAPLPTTPRHSGRRVFGGFAFDLSLVATLAALVYALGLYPGRSTPAPQEPLATTAAPAAAAAPIKKPTTTKPAAATPKPASTPTAEDRPPRVARPGR